MQCTDHDKENIVFKWVSHFQGIAKYIVRYVSLKQKQRTIETQSIHSLYPQEENSYQVQL
jgi:hypothetical protein